MKSIYLLLTKSNTVVSKAIYQLTQDSYTHISISFEENLQPMYSCARKYTYTPLPAGLRAESLVTGFYGRYKDIPCALLELVVSDDIYLDAKNRLDAFLVNANDYKYNLMGLIFCKLEVPYRRNNYYFCSEFVSEILGYSKAIELPKLPCLMKPSDFLNLDEMKCLYVGTVGDLVIHKGLS